ncbi:MYG1 exonuclease [Linum perenne]
MLALTTTGFKQKLFSTSSSSILNFPKTLPLPRPLQFLLMATPPKVSSPPYSTASTNKRVGTHNGTFHCDEALGCFMIRLTKKFSHAEIVRTRDPQVLETLDAVLDVGGVYDPSRDRYDHHQKGFEEVFGHGFSTKLSSAGLVYKHFGKEIIAKELQVEEEHPDVLRLFLAIYKSFMEAIDAVDNGINRYDTDQPPKYVHNTHLSSRVGRLNLDWIEPDQSSEKENEAFQRAMALAGSEFLDWKLHLFELEEEMKIEPSIKYVLYQDDRSKHWRIQAMAVSPDSFESRKALPAQWRGLRDADLSNEAEIPACVFVHMSGFIGGNQSYEGALAMAKAALKL